MKFIRWLIKLLVFKKYKKTDGILTKAEMNFYTQMLPHFNHDEMVMMKVRMLDIVEPANKKAYAYKKILHDLMPKHADFVLLEKETLNVKAVIELDDSSHQEKKAKENDELKNMAYKQSGIPLIRVVAKRRYNAEKIRNIIDKAIIKVQESEKEAA